MQPGQTVSPDGSNQEPTWQYRAEVPTTQPESPQPVPAQPVAPAPLPQPAATQPEPTEATDEASVSWTASEFIAHAKSAGWYLLVFICFVAFASLVFFVTKDKISAVVIVIFGIIFMGMAARKPRELQYLVDDRGIRIADKDYPYDTFRSFSVVDEAGIESIWFMPLKRFMPIVTIYFDPQDGDKIADILSRSLPFEDRQPDTVYRPMHRIRF